MNHLTNRDRMLADIALLVTAAIWGVNIPIVKAAIGAIEPLTFNALRMILSTITLGLLCCWESNRRSDSSRQAENQQPVPLRQWLLFAGLSGVFYPFLFMSGIDRTTAGNTALLISTLPVWTALISFFVIRERLGRFAWMGILVCLIGAGLVALATGSVTSDRQFQVGNLLVVASAICWSTATVVSSPILRRVTALKLAFVSSMITTPIQLLIVSPDIPVAIQQFDRPLVLMALAYSGIMSTGIAYATWHFGVSLVGGSHAAVYQNLVVVFAIVTAWLMLAEAITLTQVVGGAVLFVGLFLMRKDQTPASTAEES